MTRFCEDGTVLSPTLSANWYSTITASAMPCCTRVSTSSTASALRMPFKIGVDRGIGRHEERAAVLIGLDGEGICTNSLGFVSNLLLIHANERAQHDLGGGIFDSNEILDSLRRHLTQAITGLRALARRASCPVLPQCAP